MRKRRKPAARGGRYIFMFTLLFLSLCAVAGRLVYLQIIAAPAFAEQAEDQRLRGITLSPHRGAIYDREGEPLAISMEARTVYATPHSVADPEGAAAALAKVLGGKSADYLEKLTKDANFVYIARKVDMDRAATLEALGLAGIGLHEDWRRVYPSGELACQVLGFVGVDDEGLAGLEKQYDSLLAGEAGSVLAERDPQGRPIPGGVMERQEPVDGSSMLLSIDKDIQYEAQVELAAAVKEWGAASGSVIVMDPRNGEVLAMATVPGFNPNSYSDAEPAAHRNRPITDMYEPGSTAKSITASAIIEEGLYGPDSVFNLPPKIEVGGRTIGESHPRPTVDWSLAEIVTYSSNVGAVKLGQALGPETLYQYLDRFGFTRATGVDFPGESPGSVPPIDTWSASSIGTIPFGQGIAVTPLQLARAMSAIANGGELVTPHFLVGLPEDPDTELAWPKERIISEETSREMCEILKRVVDDGTGGAAAVPGYAVAGKTGTAQKPRTDGRGYAQGKYVGSFVGFIPAEDPQVLIAVSLDEPSNAIYGGAVAGPTFSRIAEFAVSHLKIPPSTAVSVDATATAHVEP
ncbi:MAG: penicillin-binding protein 2 [Coriobacteriia bacterium]|nr:penicillin-binding protein 2 [Coriobacteriia bacterium]